MRGTTIAKRGRPPKDGGKSQGPTSVCVQCGNRKPLNAFYRNQLWKDNGSVDSWCKDCAQAYVQNRDTLIYYLQQNNRVMVDSLWSTCLEQAGEEPAFQCEKELSREQQEALQRAAALRYFQQMNLRAYYGFQRNILPEQQSTAVQNAQGRNYIPGDDIAEHSYHTKMVYSAQWGGYFSQAALDRLDALYKELEDSYPLDTVDDRISAREYARITVQAEQAFQAFQSGDAEALKQYNTLLDRRQKISNDSQFTKKTRPKEVVDENDLLLGMLAKRLEAEGLLLRPTRVFPQDELDALIEETRHLAACLGDGGSV